MSGKRYITEFLVDGQVSEGLRSEVSRLERQVRHLGPAFESELTRMERASAMAGQRMRRVDPFGRGYAKKFAKIEQLKQAQTFKASAAVIKQRKALAALYKQQEQAGRSSEKLTHKIRATGRELRDAKRAAREHGLAVNQVQDVYDGYIRKMDKAERSIRRLAMVERGFKGGARAVGRGLDRYGGYAALAGGAALAGAARYVGNLEERVERLGVAFQMPTEKAQELKDRIFEASQMSKARINPDLLFSAVEKIADKTGNVAFASKKNLETLAMAIQGTGVEGEHLAAIFTELQDFGLKTPEEYIKALTLLIQQGKTAAFTLQNLASQGERVSAAMGHLRQKDQRGLREMGALVQVFKGVTQSPEQAATLLEALARQMWAKADKIQKELNVKVSELSPDTGELRIRSLLKVIPEIYNAAKGDPTKISKFFEENALKAVLAFMGTKGQGLLKSAMSATDDPAKLVADSQRIANTPNAKMTNILTSFKAVSDKKFSGMVDQVSSFLGDRSAEEQQEFINKMIMGGGAVGAAWLLGKGFKGGSKFLAMLKGTGGERLTRELTRAAGGLGLPGGAAPVRVTNWPVGMGTGDFIPGGGKGKTGGAKKIGEKILTGTVAATAAGIQIGAVFLPWALITSGLIALSELPGTERRQKEIRDKIAEIEKRNAGKNYVPPTPEQWKRMTPAQREEAKRHGMGGVNVTVNVNQTNNLAPGTLAPETEEALKSLADETAALVRRGIKDELDRGWAQEWQ